MVPNVVSKSFIADYLYHLGVWVVLAIFAKKTAVFGCLTNALAPLPIALERGRSSNGSASLVDCTRKKIFFLGGAGFL